MKFFVSLFLLFFSIENVESMCWVIENNSHDKFNIGFVPREKEINIIISCDEKSYNSLDVETKALFHKIGEEFCYSRLDRSHETKTEDGKDEASTTPEDQKLVCSGNPKGISIAELADIVRKQKVIFYTGAGISAGSVPVMDELVGKLGFSQELKKDANLQKHVAEIIRNPDPYVEILQHFFDRCQSSEPSVAHHVLAKIIGRYGHILVTENVDQLHQKTGLHPIVFPGRNENREQLEKQIMAVDFIITIGLNSDEGGFLKWYKDRKPTGKIISINLVNTCFLSEDDFSIKGDAQQIIKQLGEIL